MTCERILLISLYVTKTANPKDSYIQGYQFSQFSLISDFFTLTILKVIFEISSYKGEFHVSEKVIVLFQTFS